MKIGLLFAGQGSQRVQMANDFYRNYTSVKQLYEEIRCPFDIKEVTFEGPQTLLDQTMYAQSCIVLATYAMSMVLKEYGIVAEMVAGLSLGEYTALAYAQSMSIQDAITICYQRGEIMQNALPPNTSGMVAVLQTDVSVINKALKHAQSYGCCEIANYNCPGQIVITGTLSALKQAVNYLKAAGVKRTVMLPVSGAFHSSLLKPAAQKFERVLSQFTFAKPKIPVVYNCLGTISDEPVAKLLYRHMTSSVYFWQSIETMIKNGVDTFVEVGPKPHLQSFVKRVNSQVTVFSISDVDSLKQVVEALK